MVEIATSCKCDNIWNSDRFLIGGRKLESHRLQFE